MPIEPLATCTVVLPRPASAPPRLDGLAWEAVRNTEVLPMPALGGTGLRLRRVSTPEAAVIGEHLVCYQVHHLPSDRSALADHGACLKAEWLRLLDHWTCCAANSLRREAVALQAQGGEAPASWAAYLVAARCLLQGELDQVLDSPWCGSLLQLDAPLPPSLRSALLHALDLQIHAGGVLDDAGRARANAVLEEMYPALQGTALDAMRHSLLAHLFASLHRQAIAGNSAGTEFRVIHLHVPPAGPLGPDLPGSHAPASERLRTDTPGSGSPVRIIPDGRVARQSTADGVSAFGRA